MDTERWKIGSRSVNIERWTIEPVLMILRDEYLASFLQCREIKASCACGKVFEANDAEIDEKYLIFE